MGRVASRIAAVLRGKHKASYTPHNDNGDFVIVVNAENAKLTGRKNEQKEYYHHTGYFGGIKSITAEKLREKDATLMVEKAVKGMLPKTSLGRKMFGKLKVYNGAEHPHSAQQPQVLTWRNTRDRDRWLNNDGTQLDDARTQLLGFTPSHQNGG